MIDLIRLGDATDHGGAVITASNSMHFDGRRVARKGDEVSCPKHDIRPNLIIEGDDTMLDDGVPIARHGYRAMCGCRLISSLV
ncbi:PAAR domain-containing protein [Burkholderia cenocepacia]|uniref:PAAR motif family protein n=1 Tax=Burkholderia cenocepacia TaxID=95486 RepID=A0AAD0NBB4_9BURK|nr:PAAR domain-containing protein [Burkholderia cenocepacia]AWG27611.1 PAAR motif family protein [Burkholderia cenocepacia]ELK7722080.1 PAAR domain-containing protein [Burkholderia cenocepacia]MCA7961745.1 PAAR domain-containing protein [Burkholderia cenocepacia]MCF1369457.1 PAAR domain-containing protein [Burkholderia cenocepacia]MCF1386512.1 PAAR domain-containing protein [Burkholderia cenocepacia]